METREIIPVLREALHSSRRVKLVVDRRDAKMVKRILRGTRGVQVEEPPLEESYLQLLDWLTYQEKPQSVSMTIGLLPSFEEEAFVTAFGIYPLLGARVG